MNNCPGCDTTIPETPWLYGFRSAVRLDFYEKREELFPLRQEPIICTTCGLGGLRYWWNSLEEYVEPYRMPKYGPTDLSSLRLDEQFERCGQTLEAIGATEFVQADVWLRASWAAFEFDDHEAERFYQLRAITNFAVALAEDQVHQEDIVRVTYLVGELSRRVGKPGDAKVWFERVLQTEGPEWIHKLSRRQRDNPQEWFGRS